MSTLVKWSQIVNSNGILFALDELGEIYEYHPEVSPEQPCTWKKVKPHPARARVG